MGLGGKKMKPKVIENDGMGASSPVCGLGGEEGKDGDGALVSLFENSR